MKKLSLLFLATLALLGNGSALAQQTTRPDSNQVSSPVRALYALSMLRAGAGSTTAVEMDAVLGLPDEHHAAMNALLATVQYFDGDPVSVDEEHLDVIHRDRGGRARLAVDRGQLADELARSPHGQQHLAGVAGLLHDLDPARPDEGDPVRRVAGVEEG